MDVSPIGIPSHGVSVCEVSEGLFLPLAYLPRYIAPSLMVVYSDSPVIVPMTTIGKYNLVFPYLWCMLIQSEHFGRYGNILIIDPFFNIGFEFHLRRMTEILWIVMRTLISKNTAGGCVSVLCCLRTGLMGLERISHGWNVY